MKTLRVDGSECGVAAWRECVEWSLPVGLVLNAVVFEGCGFSGVVGCSWVGGGDGWGGGDGVVCDAERMGRV